MLAIGLTPFFLLLILSIVAPMISECSCGNRIIRRYRSPDDQYEIVLFQRDCGATTGYSTQSSILKAEKDLPGRKGNIFIADDGDRYMPLASDGSLVDIKWISKDKVFIKYPKDFRVFLNKKIYKDISIEYEAQ